ncbi:MAG: IMP cyclohydrolase [Candidatus Adiutrix intracellularis]|nr:MAG: IMP cyclohydrolase [Candidatus Adiutrix intracellularis]
MEKIKRALISVSDKSGLLNLARTLAALEVEILSTGGTAKTLIEGGLKITEVAMYTGSPEILDGRVKTLHPKIHAGLLYRRDRPEHKKQMAHLNFNPIDFLVVNLYPFESTTAQPNITLDEAIENIDIGGPCLLRAAAKNFDSVTVVCDSADYDRVTAELKKTGHTSLTTRRTLAYKVFARTSAYDQAIAEYLVRN